MRKILLFALMLSGMITGAQNSITNGSCKAYFRYAVNDKLMSPIPSTAIDFYDKSEGNAVAWFWDFGDGNTSQQQNPSFVFTYPLPANNIKISPYRTVSLTILTSDSCKSLYSEIINIMDGNTYQPPLCKAGFVYYQAAYDVNGGTASYQLTNLSEGDSLSYFWKFDNGQTSTEKEPVVTFDIKPTEHQVCLTVTGKNNCTDVFCGIVSFTDPDTPIIYPADCFVDFGYTVNYTVKTYAPALVLDFHSKANPEVIEWNWDFGDGITNNEQNPTHIYELPIVRDSLNGFPNPFREVCLTVKTASGCITKKCETINIFMDSNPPVEPAPACIARYKYYQAAMDSIAGTVTIQFNDRSEGESLSYVWFFNNGLTSTDKEPTVTFEMKQLPLKASLTITGANNCTDVFWDVVDYEKPIVYPVDTVNAQCQAWFKYDKATDVFSIPELIPYRLWDTSEGKVVSRIWQFEDGTIRTEAEPLVLFDFMKPTQKVCLTIFTDDSCSSSQWETIQVTEMRPDTVYTGGSSEGYSMHYISGFPIYMSSCAGYAKAQVYLKDSPVEATNYVWSIGVEGQEAKGLCPTQTYTVKATTPDGTVVSGTFIFNSDGSVTDNSINWWVSGDRDNTFIQCKPFNKDYFVEWQLCDGTIVRSDSIPLKSINCGGSDVNLVMRDAAGNEVYTENISMKALITYLGANRLESTVKLFPNPVNDVLNIQYSGNRLNEMQVEIFDITGKSVSTRKIYQVESGQNISLNVYSLQKGIYLCRMVSGKQIISVEKFTK